MKVYQYPRCSTCRKAVKFLRDAGLEFELQDIVTDPPSKAQLKKAHALSGLPLKKLFNTSGQSYRDGGYKEKLPSMSDDEALSALASDGKLIKRPLLVDGELVLVGFRETQWREALGLE